MAGYKILKVIADDLAREYGASGENYIRVQGKIICDTLCENYFAEMPITHDELTALAEELISDAGEKAYDFCDPGTLYTNDNGFLRRKLRGDDCIIDICTDAANDIIFIHADKEQNESYVRAMLDNIEILCVRCIDPHLEKYGKNNAGRAVRLSCEPYQLAYACDVKSALCYAYAYGRESYCLTDGLRVTGVLVTDIRDDVGEIEYIATDRKYQHKGYGRYMVNQAIELLRERGCTRIIISVQEDNIAAKHLYQSCGFCAVSHTDDYDTYELAL